MGFSKMKMLTRLFKHGSNDSQVHQKTATATTESVLGEFAQAVGEEINEQTTADHFLLKDHDTPASPPANRHESIALKTPREDGTGENENPDAGELFSGFNWEDKT